MYHAPRNHITSSQFFVYYRSCDIVSLYPSVWELLTGSGTQITDACLCSVEIRLRNSLTNVAEPSISQESVICSKERHRNKI